MTKKKKKGEKSQPKPILINSNCTFWNLTKAAVQLGIENSAPEFYLRVRLSNGPLLVLHFLFLLTDRFCSSSSCLVLMAQNANLSFRILHYLHFSPSKSTQQNQTLLLFM